MSLLSYSIVSIQHLVLRGSGGCRVHITGVHLSSFSVFYHRGLRLYDVFELVFKLSNTHLQIIISPSFVILLCRPGRKITSPIRMFVTFVGEEIVLLRRKSDLLVVYSFQITRRCGVNRVNFTSRRLFGINMSKKNIYSQISTIVASEKLTILAVQK